MTIEEMREVINEHCRGRACCDCKVKTQCNKCGGLFSKHPKECEEAYDILMSLSKEDAVNHPNHYTAHGMECIDEMLLIFGEEATAHFCLLNAWKYRKRAMYKNGQEDMDKADWYIAKYKELKEEHDPYY